MTIENLKAKYADELAVIKSILEIVDTNKDAAIILAIEKAYRAILNYTGWTVFDVEYMGAIYSLAIAYFNNDTLKYKTAKGEQTITQQTQGSRSATYGDSKITINTEGLTDDVKAMLPLPKLRCF